MFQHHGLEESQRQAPHGETKHGCQQPLDVAPSSPQRDHQGREAQLVRYTHGLRTLLDHVFDDVQSTGLALLVVEFLKVFFN